MIIIHAQAIIIYRIDFIINIYFLVFLRNSKTELHYVRNYALLEMSYILIYCYMREVNIMIIDAFTISAAVIAMAVIISVIALMRKHHEER